MCAEFSKGQVSTSPRQIRGGFVAGQVSTEILVLIGMMLLLLLPLFYYAYSRSNVAREDIAVQKVDFAAQRLKNMADSVGYLGGASALVDEIEIPTNVRTFGVSGHDIVFEIDSSTGKKQIVKSSAFEINASGSLAALAKPGTYFVQVSAVSDYSGNSGQVRMELK